MNTEAFIVAARALDLESEMVVGPDRTGFDQSVEEFLFGCLPVDVHVA